jgi:hypothetical protein
MKVRVNYTIEVCDDFRRALNFRYGRPGLATRKEVKEHCIEYGTSIDNDIMYEWDKYESTKD